MAVFSPHLHSAFLIDNIRNALLGHPIVVSMEKFVTVAKGECLK